MDGRRLHGAAATFYDSFDDLDRSITEWGTAEPQISTNHGSTQDWFGGQRRTADSVDCDILHKSFEAEMKAAAKVVSGVKSTFLTE